MASSEPQAMSAPSNECPGTIKVIGEMDEVTALDLDGEFDMSVSPQIIEHAERIINKDQHLIVNLTEATFIDSSVVHALLTVDALAKARGRSFVLQVATADTVKRVLSITSAYKLLETAPARAKAIELIERHSKAAQVRH